MLDYKHFFNIPYSRNYFRLSVLIFLAASTYLLIQQLFFSHFSDMKLHVLFTMENNENGGVGYSLLHKLIVTGKHLFHLNEISSLLFSRVALILIVLASQLSTIVIIHRFYNEKLHHQNLFLVDIMSLFMMIISMLIIHPFSKTLFLGVGSPNPWHNPTYLFSRPFSLLLFIYCLKFIDDAKSLKWNFKTLLVICICAVFSVWAKPSFMLSFLPALMLFLGIQLFKKQLSFSQALVVALLVLPSFLPLLSINQDVYHAAKSSNKIVISPGEVWGLYSNSILLSVVLGLAFPLYVLMLNFSKMPNSLLLAFINLIASALLFYLLKENGDRMTHANFGWTYLFGIFFMFLTSIETFFLSKKSVKGFDTFGAVLFGLHVVSGLYYFGIVLLGHNYY